MGELFACICVCVLHVGVCTCGCVGEWSPEAKPTAANVANNQESMHDEENKSSGSS